MKYRLLFVVLSVIALCSCSDKVRLWEDYDCVVDRNGKVENYEIQHGKPFVVTMYPDFRDFLYDTPRGKINDIIEDNPDWEFVFYCDCSYYDVSELQNILDYYDCDFPVIIDLKRKVWNINRMGNVGMSLICDKDGEFFDGGIIGSSLSSFDSMFAKAKRVISR